MDDLDVVMKERGEEGKSSEPETKEVTWPFFFATAPAKSKRVEWQTQTSQAEGKKKQVAFIDLTTSSQASSHSLSQNVE